MLQLVQAGSGTSRPLVIAYFCGNRDALIAGAPPEACILNDVDNSGSRFTLPPGHGIDTIDTAVAFAAAHAGLEGPPAAVVLIGWSAGCQAVREQLRAGAAPDAVLCLDGIAGSIPPVESQLAPWRPLVARARASEALFVITHTAMEYTEHLPRMQAFESTTHMAAAVTGTAGATPPETGTITPVDGELYVLGYPSKDIDGPAHIYQQTSVMPDILRRVIFPWLRLRAGAALAAPVPAPADDGEDDTPDGNG